MLDVLHEPRFVDKTPYEIYGTLMDEGTYLCSISTMYRILRANNEVAERRRVSRHPVFKKPELEATAPNQVWSWDITKLKGPEKWQSYKLYVMLDIFSRMVVGWRVEYRESAELAAELIEESCKWQNVRPNELSIHSDRGAPMTSNTVAQLLVELGVLKSLSRPRVCDDNAFSESHFKTVKHGPTFPERFGSIEDARVFMRHFFDWYNNEHHHTGIALMTPATVHYGLSAQCNEIRAEALARAFNKHPERFVKGAPQPPELPKAVWINQPVLNVSIVDLTATAGSGARMSTG